MARERTEPLAVRWQWLDMIDPPRQESMARLLNRVLEVDDTVGHPGPIPHAEALAIVGDMAKDVEARRSYVLVAEAEDDIVGQCVLVPNRWPNNRHIAWVVRTMIEPGSRARGILSHGLRLLGKKGEELGLSTICIDVRRGTSVEALWRRMGFKVFGVLEDYSRVNGKSFEGAYMFQTVAELRRRWND